MKNLFSCAELCAILHGANANCEAVSDNSDKEAYYNMKHIKTLTTRDYKESMKKGGCGECQTSCQSACKTSCTVGNQSCENTK